MRKMMRRNRRRRRRIRSRRRRGRRRKRRRSRRKIIKVGRVLVLGTPPALANLVDHPAQLVVPEHLQQLHLGPLELAAQVEIERKILQVYNMLPPYKRVSVSLSHVWFKR